MFHKEFYPTPPDVIAQMIGNRQVKGKVFFEPHGGKADIIKYLKKRNAKEVFFSEITQELHLICSKHGVSIGTDFFNVRAEQISHVDFIIMNPPFSNADKHIQHAWSIAPDGCEIIALCNSNNIDERSYGYRELKALIKNYGKETHLGDCFSTSERKTSVEVSLIELFKPAAFGQEDDMSSYFDLSEEYIKDSSVEGVVNYDEIDSLINRYVGAMKLYNSVPAISEQMSVLTKGFLRGKIGYFEYNGEQSFKKQLLKGMWHYVFNLLNANKYMNRKLSEKLNKFVEQNENVPFKKQNIYTMIDIIIQTHPQRINDLILDVYDKVTRHSHKNRYGVEGWKTNESYIIGKKIILNGGVKIGFHGNVDISYGRNASHLDDIHNALQFLTRDYRGVQSLYNFIKQGRKTIQKDENGEEKIIFERVNDFGVWYDFGAFEVKFFKKGTVHARFKREKDWELLNRKVSEAMGNPIPDFVWRKEKPKKRERSYARSTKVINETIEEISKYF